MTEVNNRQESRTGDRSHQAAGQDETRPEGSDDQVEKETVRLLIAVPGTAVAALKTCPDYEIVRVVPKDSDQYLEVIDLVSLVFGRRVGPFAVLLVLEGESESPVLFESPDDESEQPPNHAVILAKETRKTDGTVLRFGMPWSRHSLFEPSDMWSGIHEYDPAVRPEP